MTTMLVKAPYDRAPVRRYINPTIHHALFRQGFDRHIEEVLPRTERELFLTLILHPDEVNLQCRPHPLYSFCLAEVEENIRYMIGSLEMRGLDLQSLVMRDVPSIVGCAPGERMP